MKLKHETADIKFNLANLSHEVSFITSYIFN